MGSNYWRFLLAICMLPIWGNASVQAQEDNRVLIRAKHVYSADELWGEPGEILIVNQKIAFVGDKVDGEVPEKVIEVDTVMPGIVNIFSSAGVAGGDAEVSREITPEFHTFSAVDFDDRQFAEAVDEGVTTLQILPGTDSVFAGLSCVVKTAGEIAERKIDAANNLVLAISSDPTSRNRARSRPDEIYVRQPTNRMGVVWIVRTTLHQAAQGEVRESIDPKTGPVLQDLLEGKLPALSVSRTDFDIRSALDLGDEFGIRPVIYGGDEAYRIIDELKEREAKIVYTALASSAGSLRGNEGTDLRWNVPGRLADADIEFCLAGASLLDQARFAVRFGLDPKLALQAITQRPATMIGQAERLGTISVGKDADLVALSGDPLKPTSGIQWTMVSGKIYGSDKSEK